MDTPARCALSLRSRAVLIAGLSLLLLWSLAAFWMIRSVNQRVQETLDGRLEMSAQMVSGLLQQSDIELTTEPTDFSKALADAGLKGIACEIRSLRHPELPEVFNGSIAPLELPQGLSTRAVDGQQWRLYVLRTPDYQVTTADRVEQRMGLSRELLAAAGVPFLIAVLGGLAMLWLAIDRGLSPLNALSDQLRSRTATSLAPVEIVPCPGELTPVLDAMNGLLQRLATTVSGQRAFTDAAAHELRTPLTVIDTHLQVARAAQGAERERSLAFADQGVKQLSRTLQQLLDLARSETDPAGTEPCTSTADALMLAWEQLDQKAWSRISLNYPLADAKTNVPLALLQTAVRNLLDNALKYSKGPIEVSMRASAEGGYCTLHIADRGPGLTPTQMTSIGRRFWRGDQELRGTAGAGLGISIVRAVLEPFGGRVSFHARHQGGLRVEVSIPTPP